jgi:hypothetical protein
MSGPEIMAAVGFFVTLLGALSGIWWRVEGKISSAAARADKVAADLSAHKLHVAETYTTKSGMREIKEEILGAVSGIRDDVRHLATRIDNMHEHQSTKRPVRRAAD